VGLRLLTSGAKVPAGAPEERHPVGSSKATISSMGMQHDHGGSNRYYAIERASQSGCPLVFGLVALSDQTPR
jgi:hypothetical protein